MNEYDKKRLFEAQISALLVLRQEDFSKLGLNDRQKKFINYINTCANCVTNSSLFPSSSTSDISEAIDHIMDVLHKAYNKSTEEELVNFITKEVDKAILEVLFLYRSL